MSPRPHLVAILRKNVLVGSRVVEQSQRVISHVGECVEEAWSETHSEADGAHDFDVQMVAGYEKRLHDGGEDITRGVMGPVVGVAWLVVTTYLERFFEVGVDTAEGGDKRGVGELGYFFTAVGDVTAVGFGGGLGRVSCVGHRGIRI